jgi:3-hydroxymyristoyl/3-hydroxydecanoyl-(acyl carrier protein) dehydratase
VKIGGKRLALPEMEARLLQHPDVAEAALTAIEARGESRVAAAIVLSRTGLARLARLGRRALGAELAGQLAPYWDRVLVPRQWRFVERLPEDEQGKVATAALARLFDVERGDGSLAPELLAASTTGTTCRQRWRVPDTLAWCQGHFPEMAVVPGFVQIGWIMDAARSLVGERAALVGLDAVKFRELLRPGDVVELHADWAPAAGQLAYRLARDDGRIVASGRCRLIEDRQ